MKTQYFNGNWLAAVAGVGAAILGLLMLVGGVGLSLAVISSPQPRLQMATAFVLLVAGFINLWTSLRVWRAEQRALLVSGAVTTALIAYLGIGLRDFGEPFWAHSVYLLVVFGLWSQVVMRRGIAA